MLGPKAPANLANRARFGDPEERLRSAASEEQLVTEGGYILKKKRRGRGRGGVFGGSSWWLGTDQSGRKKGLMDTSRAGR